MAKTKSAPQISKLSKFTFFISLLFLTLLVISSSLLVKTVRAVTPIPPSGRIPCKVDQTENPNFSSDRPYQASPCADSPKASWCGNSLQIIEDTPSKTVPGIVDHLEVDMEMPAKTYAFDVSNAQFPIEGNTEITKNSQSSSDISDAQKMNEYLSWYLNGVNQTAEYGNTDSTTAEGNSKIIDYSGPIKKLLPSAILDYRRITTLNTLQNVTYTPEGVGNASSPPTTNPGNHNQIVACADIQPFYGWFGQIFGLVQHAIAKPCYENNGGGAAGKTYRLDDWINGDITFQRTFTNTFSQTLSVIFPGFGNLLNSVAGDQWNHRFPPVPWGVDQNGKPFRNNVSFQKAYNEWRGETCVIIPGINVLVCARNPTITNEYSDLWQYVPLANTGDNNAKQYIGTVVIQGLAGTVIEKQNIAYIINQEAVLMFAHTQETATLSGVLNSTYIPKTGNPNAENIDNTVETNDMNTCRLVPVRSNPGDNLFPEVSPSEIKVYVAPIHVSEIPCHTVYRTRRGAATAKGGSAGGEESTIIESLCRGQVNIEIKQTTKVPYADEIFNSTVAGPESAFRKIYPKVEEGAPVSCIQDIPSVTNVTYTATQGVENGKFKVIGPDDRNSTDNPQIFFPHIGSVYDYFLKGIQTALRPKGFGEPTPDSGTLCVSAVASGDCSFNKTAIDKAIASAASKYNVPAPLLKAIVQIESADAYANPSSYNCVENSAHAMGVSQVTRDTYQFVTCSQERLTNDTKVCGQTPGKLSRCSISDSIELEARVLLWKSGKLNSCRPTGSMSLSDKTEWYNAACNYYGTFEPDQYTINFANDYPTSQRRANGQMNYCDDVCMLMGQCSGTNYPPQSGAAGAGTDSANGNSLLTPQ